MAKVNYLTDTELEALWRKWKANGGNLQKSGPKPEKPPVPTIAESSALIESMIDDLMSRRPADRRAGLDPELREEQDRLLTQLMRR